MLVYFVILVERHGETFGNRIISAISRFTRLSRFRLRPSRTYYNAERNDSFPTIGANLSRTLPVLIGPCPHEYAARRVTENAGVEEHARQENARFDVARSVRLRGNYRDRCCFAGDSIF